MKTLLLAAVIGAGMLGAPCAAWSQLDRGNFYLGAAIGETKMKNACEGAPSAISCDDKDNAWKFFAGYQLTPNFAVEVGYNNLGTAKATGSGSLGSVETADLSALELTALASWPLGNRFAVYGKLGVFYGEMEAGNDNAVPAVFPPPPRRGWVSDSHTDLTFGIGASYTLTGNAAFRVEWQRFNGLGGRTAPKLNVDVVSVGALYRFSALGSP